MNLPSRWCGAACTLVTLALLTGCATAATSPTSPTSPTAIALAPAPPDLGRQPIVLLGEVHDNAAQHALRLQAFRRLLATGARPALLMEQFDRERQGELDRLRHGPAPASAQTLIDAAGGPGWDWHFYRPFIDEALKHGLEIVAANVSRQDARRVIGAGLTASGFDAAVPEAVAEAHAQAIVASHCGMVALPMARRMGLAQVARDQYMARLVEQHQARGVLLLAGNGHVRSDIGVPRWLSPATRARSLAIGVLEPGDTDRASFDEVVVTTAQPREDPCAAMSAPAPARAGSAPAAAPAMR